MLDTALALKETAVEDEQSDSESNYLDYYLDTYSDFTSPADSLSRHEEEDADTHQVDTLQPIVDEKKQTEVQTDVYQPINCAGHKLCDCDHGQCQ